MQKKWKGLEEHVVNINTDCASDSIIKDAGLRRILRNQSGQPLGVMGKRFNCYLALEVEAMVVMEAVQWACYRGGWSIIVIEIDSKIIFEALTIPGRRIPRQIKLILHEIKQDKSKFHMFKISLVH